MGNDLLPSLSRLTPDQQAAWQIAIARLMAKRAARYSLGQDTSLPEETAREMMESVLFTLKQVNAQAEAPSSGELSGMWEAGIAKLEQKLVCTRRLLDAVASTSPCIDIRAYRDTLRSLAGFANRYDYRYFACRIPCTIDYQLCHPLPEELCGVDYVNGYLRLLLIENLFLMKFPSAALRRFCEQSTPAYSELLMELYEPVAAQAAGLSLLGRPPEALILSAGDREQIKEMLSGCQGEEIFLRLQKAGRSIARKFELAPAQADYLMRAVEALLPRIEAGFGRRTLPRKAKSDGLFSGENSGFMVKSM